MSDTRTNFLGIPVEGDINRGSGRTEQRPLSELEPLLRAVIDDDGISDFGWTQYTPYFNDGDPCIFGVGEPWFRTPADVTPRSDDDEDDEDEDGPDEMYQFELHGHPTLAAEHWDGERYVKVERDEATLARYARCKALSAAIGSGAFDDVLLDAFGDHANVRVRSTGITVDEYSHD